jgi:hypothetical protein
MSIINRYADNQRAYVTKKQAQPLIGFTNVQGEPASWNDIAVTFTDSDNKHINIMLCNLNKKNSSVGTRFTDDDRLKPEIHKLLFAYALDVLKENISPNNKKEKIARARYFLCYLDKNVAMATLDEIQHAIDSMKYIQSLPLFINWLHQHQMLAKSCQPYINTTVNSTRSKSGNDALDAEQNKLPSEKALLALGAIFYDVIPLYQGDNNKNKNIDAWQPLLPSVQVHKDSFTCTMVALGMASPNRIGAEQVLLTPQRIQSHAQVVEGQEKTVHYLNWRGSKGWKDNQNHINAEMVESLDKALHYTILATEPTRALARFYRKPARPLKEVLGEFKPSDENLALIKPSMNKSTNLLHLSLLLGFFDDSDKYVRVTPTTKGTIRVGKDSTKFIKPIAQLKAFDTLTFKGGCPYANLLTGCNPTTLAQYNSYTGGKKELTVAEFQNFIIEKNQGQLKGYNNTQSKYVDFDNALFAYTQKQLGGKVKNPFLLVPISSLSGLFYSDLTKVTKTRPTIFERHGFSSSFLLKPHQLRHWQNDYLAKKGLSHLLITMLSGRKSVEQTLTYIHTTDAQNASVIADIFYHEKTEEVVQESVSKRLQSKEQYDAATDNLIPTFVHETGFCVQNLTLSPCTYMTEFMTQCSLCPSSCHIAHDSEAIELLKKDLQVQTHNLEQVQGAINFTTSAGMQEWYETHYKNTSMMKNLVDVLSDKSIKEGCIVRFLTRSNIIRITDLETKTVTEQKLSLPNTKEALQAAIEAKTKPANDSAKNNFLGFLGAI